MKYREIESREEHRLDRFIVRMYGEYSQYYVDVLHYFNPQIDFINLKAGTTLKVPSREEIKSITKIRGYYDLQMDSVPKIKVYPKSDTALGFITPVVPPTPVPEPMASVAVNFGNVVEGGPAVEQYFTVTNDGLVDVDVAYVNVTAGFSVSVPCPLLIPVGSSVDFAISALSTSGVGVKNGVVTIYTTAGSISFNVSAEVTADTRLTRIPVKVNPGIIRPIAGNSILVQPITAFDWEWPDGSLHNEEYLSYDSPVGGAPEYCYLKLKAGKTMSDLTNIYYSTSLAYDQIQCEDLKFARVTSHYYNIVNLVGDIKWLSSIASNLTGNFFLNVNNMLYGDITEWEPVKAAAFYIYGCNVHGTLRFISGAPTAVVVLTGLNFTPAEHSQTIVNWNACNAGVFARVGSLNSTKRSELTAAGEAAVRSLVTKTCTFTFKVEDIPTTNPAFYTVLLRDNNFTIDGAGVVVAARGMLTITGESCGATGLVPTGVEVAMGNVDATTGNYSKVDAQLPSASFAQNDVVRIKLLHPGSGIYTYRYVVAGA